MVEERGYALQLTDIHKSFFKNEVLKGITFGIKKGEVLGLLGSNGAGKSTLMKIVTGVYRLDKGTIHVDEKEVVIKDAADAAACHIAMVYQEFSLIPTMTVAENLFLMIFSFLLAAAAGLFVLAIQRDKGNERLPLVPFLLLAYVFRMIW